MYFRRGDGLTGPIGGHETVLVDSGASRTINIHDKQPVASDGRRWGELWWTAATESRIRGLLAPRAKANAAHPLARSNCQFLPPYRILRITLWSVLGDQDFWRAASHKHATMRRLEYGRGFTHWGPRGHSLFPHDQITGQKANFATSPQHRAGPGGSWSAWPIGSQVPAPWMPT